MKLLEHEKKILQVFRKEMLKREIIKVSFTMILTESVMSAQLI